MPAGRGENVGPKGLKAKEVAEAMPPGPPQRAPNRFTRVCCGERGVPVRGACGMLAASSPQSRPQRCFCWPRPAPANVILRGGARRAAFARGGRSRAARLRFFRVRGTAAWTRPRTSATAARQLGVGNSNTPACTASALCWNSRLALSIALFWRSGYEEQRSVRSASRCLSSFSKHLFLAR